MDSSKRKPDLCVFHLIWAPLGLRPFGDFLSSYRANPSGVPHRLRLLLNGFESEADVEPYLALLDGIEAETQVVSPPVQDIPAYFQGARAVDSDFLCFLNSYVTLTDHGWLEKLHRHAVREDVGVVGATGSYESSLGMWANDEVRSGRGIRGRIRSLIRRLPRRLAMRGHLERQWMLRLGAFRSFPNPHIRSNGFMIRRKRFLSLVVNNLEDKWDCFEFESGRRSMTNQILKMGLKALVAGRDGKSYEFGEWFESRTFRNDDQSNLLISDNHTRDFDNFDHEGRRHLSLRAWGDRASERLCVDESRLV